MAARRRTAFPSLPADASKELVAMQTELIQDTLNLRAEAIGHTTSTQSASFSIKFSEAARVLMPAAGGTITAPVAGPQTQDRWFEVIVLGGGPVKVQPTSGQIDGTASVTLTTVGRYAWSSDGLSGWWRLSGASGGGGLSPPVALASLANAPADTVVGNITGASAPHVDVPLSSLAGTGLTYNATTHKFDASGGGGIVTGNATLNFGNAPGTNVVSVAVPDAGIAAGSNVQAWIQGNDSTATHNAVEHQMLPLGPLSLTAISITPGVGFTLQAMTPLRVRGTFLARWARS